VSEALGRIAKCIALFGSDNAGERASAIAVAEKTLIEAGLNWTAIGELVARGHNAEREKLFAELLAQRLRAGLAAAWTMCADGDARFCRELTEQCATGAVAASVDDIRRAVSICDEARRAGNAFGGGPVTRRRV
jgi:hypothetical protein